MILNEYQKLAWETALPEAKDLNYLIHGLTNEAGEVAGAYKKYLRKDYGPLELQHKLLKELGDLFWYLSGVARMAEISLEDVANVNIGKLRDRKERGTLQGSGDDR